MRTLDLLRADHRLIARMCEHALAALASGRLARLRRVLEFFMDYADGVHHRAEEEVLFVEILRRIPDLTLGPIHALHKEHELARAYLRAAREALPVAVRGNVDGLDRLEASLRALVQLLKSHAEKEETILFPMAERIIPSSLDDVLMTQMMAVRRAHLDDPAMELYRRLAEAPLDDPRTEHGASTKTSSPSMLDAKTLASTDEEEDEDESTILDARTQQVIYSDGVHKNVLLHDLGQGLQVQANQYLIVHGDEAMILDPGGPKVYPAIFAETVAEMGRAQLRYIFLSHQDPDIGTSLNAWLMDTEADAYVSRLWMRFLPHFGIDRLLDDRLKPIPDEGMWLRLGGAEVALLPAHFLHSAGNFQVYDPISKVLFSGDLGASVGVNYTRVADFDAHLRYMFGFHRRYMTAGRAMAAWARMARTLDIQVIAPQHGARFEGPELVGRFIDWCEGLACGVDLLPEAFAVPARRSA